MEKQKNKRKYYCDNCEEVYKEDELTIFDHDEKTDECFYGCPKCGTDRYLEDFEPEKLKVKEGENDIQTFLNCKKAMPKEDFKEMKSRIIEGNCDNDEAFEIMEEYVEFY